MEAGLAEAISLPGSCAGHRPRARFRFASDDGEVLRCLRHAALSRKIAGMAALTAVVVGTLLTAINQANVIVEGSFSATLLWKIPLTYLVPYCVSTFSALRVSFEPPSRQVSESR